MKRDGTVAMRRERIAWRGAVVVMMDRQEKKKPRGWPGLTRPLMSAAMLAPAEGPGTELALVLPLRCEWGFSRGRRRRSGGGEDGYACAWHLDCLVCRAFAAQEGVVEPWGEQTTAAAAARSGGRRVTELELSLCETMDEIGPTPLSISSLSLARAPVGFIVCLGDYEGCRWSFAVVSSRAWKESEDGVW